MDERLEPVLAILTLALGAALRTLQYATTSSLWVDEIKLAWNIEGRSLTQLLTQPLAHNQVAPPGFLALEKLAISALGSSELALRLIPFIAGLVALPLFWALSRRVLRGAPRSTARLLFAVSFPFIWFPAEAKQYSTDITIGLALTLLALALAERPPRGWGAAAAIVAGLAAVCLSGGAVLMVAGLGLALLALRRHDPMIRWVVVAWGVGGIVAIGWSLHLLTPETNAFMKEYWRYGFLPLPPRTLVEAAWPIERLGSLFGPAGLWYAWPGLYLALSVWGFRELFRQNREAAVLLLGPVAAALAAGGLHRYPFAGRLVAFLFPAGILSLAAAIDRAVQLARLHAPLSRAAGRLALLLPALGPVTLAPPPWRHEDSEPVIAYVASHRQAGDLVFVYYGAMEAVSYYGPRHGLIGDLIVAARRRDEPRAYLEQLDQLRGSPRVWLIFSHYVDAERRLMVDYLNQIGVARDSLLVPSGLPGAPGQGAWGYLFDLSRRPGADSR
jgi:hypothetical protein